MNNPAPSRVHPGLEPLSLGQHELRNRLAVAPMTRVSATPNGTPTQAMAEYYAAFARGGFGLVITEGTYTDNNYSQGYLNQPGIVTEDHIAGWAAVVTAIRDAGAQSVMQLMHAGALSQGNAHRTGTAGPSAVRPVGQMMPEYGGSGEWPVPAELTLTEIEDVVRGFAAAAANARRAGFSGIEIHAANGYLLDQFLTDYTNQRTDSYGGSVAGRVRLTAEIVTAVRTAVRDEDFLVGVRLSQGKVNDFHHRWKGGAADAQVIFTALADAGASYLHIASEGRDWIDTARLDDGQTITALAKKATGLPVIANGGMHDAAQAAELLDGDHADVLSLGRGALANPDLPRKLAEGLTLAEFDHSVLQPMATLDNADLWRQTAHSATS